MATKYLKKIVYFNKQNEDLYEYVEQKDFSVYVCDLIRKDMDGINETEENNILDEINHKLDMLTERMKKGEVMDTAPVMEEVKTFDFGSMNVLS